MPDVEEAAAPPQFQQHEEDESLQINNVTTTSAPSRQSKRDSFTAFIEFLHTPSTKKDSSEVKEDDSRHEKKNSKSTQQQQQQTTMSQTIDDTNNTTTNNNNLLSNSIATVQDISRLNRRSFVANFLLVLGYSFGLWFQVYEFTGRDREAIAIIVYFIAFTLLILSGVLELSVDVLSVRTVGHGRYVSDNPRWNRLISFLFVTAGALDIVAFVYWLQRQKKVEIRTLLLSSYILLVMAIVVLYFQIMETKKVSWTRTILSDKIDLAANGLIFIVTVMGVVLRQMELSPNVYGETTNRLELSTLPLWLFSSMMYASTDVLRLQTMIQEGIVHR